MRRTVKRWAPMDSHGRIPVGVTPTLLRVSAVGAKYAGETVVRVTLTWDDGRPAPKRRKAKKKGGKRA